ncbi:MULTISPECIES: hypothetical protein [unclassified Paenibacillus]|uniref:hypothetical protein n=1 Tax=unclassified Paenibacillus TaxID=185978 RepID=UPI00020D70F5|nr:MULTISPECIES: hypothetical protein [unclassified Paenibacillus]EGL16394.1 hypothetical protein HMPREF9413_1744 [Paenibacillus sp. HGF7]EPD83818.1 hypothetical protein HMPREF1207_03182 [Paenibacillus sp. HGH0039]
MNFKEVLKGRKLMLLGLLVLLFILFKMVPLLDAGQPTFWPTLIFVGCILMNMSCDIFLSPFLKQPDERMKAIRSKAYFYSYFATLIYMAAAAVLVLMEMTPIPLPLIFLDLIAFAGLTPNLLLILFFKRSPKLLS